ncbi:YDG domain-containing protein [Polynucleobacter necessarius]|uniref:YDG domain-containing protein n=1 Tax=Polynucleobacter necessarius TaxID=576610 RepID=UPI000FE18603|nr:YDG domain-containing protein [Polynucleobacter necessarius]
MTSIVSSGGTASLINYSINSAYNATAGNIKNIATITAKALTVGSGSVVADKVYDGTTAATITGGSLVGVIGSDVVSLTQAGSFAQSAVGNSIAVTAVDTLSGASATNYSIIQPTGLSASITPKSLTVSGITVSNKVYDATTAAVATTGTLVGLVAADAANVTFTKSATFSSANAGNAIAIVMNDSITGTAAGNYALTQPSGITANITPKALTVTGTSIANKVYDGTTSAAVISGGSLVGVISGDAVGLTEAASFSQSNAGTGLAVTIADALTNNAAGNYTLTQPTGFTANITPAPITVSIASQTKEYDGTNAASLTAGTSGNAGSYTLTGFVSGQGAYINQANATYNSANVASATAVTASLSPSNFIATGNTNLSNYALPNICKCYWGNHSSYLDDDGQCFSKIRWTV